MKVPHALAAITAATALISAAPASAAGPSVDASPPPTDYLAAKPSQQVGSGVRFEVRQSKSLKTATSPGRVMIFILDKRKYTKDNPPWKGDLAGPGMRTRFAEDLPGRMGPGRHFVLRESKKTAGFPLLHIRDLRAGKYVVQALFIRYMTFHLASGQTVQLPIPCEDTGASTDLFEAGNLLSNIVPVTLKPHHAVTVHLTFKSQSFKLMNPVPKGGSCQQGNPKDTPHVKQVKIKSALLSKFWGRPMYIAASVLLPAGYDNPANANVRYPEIMEVDHYDEGGAGGLYTENGKDEFSKTWDSTAPGPRMIYVYPRTETPYYDDSYGINSPNTGPWGDAINHELLPYIESHFRTIGQRWARMTTGGSTGGWTSVAQQVFYPDIYEGAFANSPDPLDFHALQIVDIYHDQNAYYQILNGVLRLPQVDVRIPGLVPDNGSFNISMQYENYGELLRGTHNRSVGVWDGAWGADFGPQGADGYPLPLWNKRTGKINHKVAQFWKRWDLTQVVTHNWKTLGPKIAGQIEVNVGESDDFYLNNGVHLFQQATNRLTNPAPSFTFRYFPLYGHEDLPVFNPDPIPPIDENNYGWDKFFQHMADHMAADAPPGAPMAWSHAAG
jgi:hypothetical protein